MRPPSVDVVLTVRDGERYIEQAIDSVIAQTLKDWRLFVVDDCSTDRTADILHAYARKEERIFQLPGNGTGIADAANVGVAATSAEYIARFDADDICFPHRLETQVATMQANDSLVALGSSVVQIDQNGKVLAKKSRPTAPADIARQLPHRNCLYHPASFVRRSYLQKVGAYRSQFRLAEDYDLWLRLMPMGDLANLAEPLIYYRKHPTQVTDRSRAAALTLYSVAASTDYFLRKYDVGDSECVIDEKNSDDIADKIALLVSVRPDPEDIHALKRHGIRLLRHSRSLSVTGRKNLLAAMRPYMSLGDRTKHGLYELLRKF